MMKTLLRSCMLATLVLLAACSSGLQSEPPSLDLDTLNSSPTLRLPILTTSDDAEEVSGGSVSTTGGLLDLRAKRGVLQSVGLRFQKVTIPQGATITGAHLEVKGGGAYTGPVTLSVRGEASDHAATFGTSRYNLSSRSTTKAAFTWQPTNWVQGGAYRTGNLAPVIQEIVNRSGWKSGNALALVINGLGSSGERAAIAYGGRPEHVPVLVVSYETASVPTPQPAPAPQPAPTPETGSVLAMSNLSGQVGGEHFYEVSVPAGATALSVTTSGGTGNADIYVRNNLKPTVSDYLCGSRKSANEESCLIAAPRTGVYHLMVHGKSEYAGVALRVNYEAATSPAPAPTPEPTPTPAPAPAPTPAPTPAPAPSPEPVTPVSPSVPSGDLSIWHDRLVATIETPNYAVALDPKHLAASGDLYKLGRELNLHVTSMILAYRETGDRDIVRHLEAVMNLAKNQLGDSNGDGFRNWRYLHTTGDHTTKPYIGTDLIALDEMLTHSMVAAAAYTFKQAGFSSSAAFWTDYLKNDFEAKWRKRSNKPSGYPFVSHFLVHPTTNFVRYHLYMHKLTGESSYYTEAARLASSVRATMRSSGSGYIWDHKIAQQTGCQPMTYVKYTTQALADVASFDSSLFNADFMARVANTMANKVLKDSSGTSLAADACGNGSFGTLNMFAQHPFAQLARWDNSGKLRTAAERAYAAFERNAPSPKSANLAATMIFTLGR